MGKKIRISSLSPQVLTLDGESAVGKGTICKLVRQMMIESGLDENKISIMDAGMTYRLFTYHMLHVEDLMPNQLQELLSEGRYPMDDRLRFGFDGKDFTINDYSVPHDDLKTPLINSVIADFAGIDEVKYFIVASQRGIVTGHDMWWILDGRCMGTAVAPYASAKVFAYADHKIKAGWRYQDYASRGISISAQEVYEELMRRDELDWNAKVHPLMIPEGSLYLETHKNTKEMNSRIVFEYFLDKVIGI